MFNLTVFFLELRCRLLGRGITGRVQALVFALSWRIAKLSLQLSKNDACTLLQAGVLSFGADSFTLLILKLLLMF
jgi:hypothetical protein